MNRETVMATIREQLLDVIDHLSEDAQVAVLEYAREKMRPVGETGSQFLQRTAAISFELSELALMQAVIKDAFEGVDDDEPQTRYF